jgi:two-component system chemotaxis sensor kinase CheA
MSFEAEMQSALATFVVEATELLSDMEANLLDLEDGAVDEEIVNAVFRAAHTIKGSAGLFGLDHIVTFTHTVESVLDRVRGHEIAVSPRLIGALLPCKDHLALLVDGIAAGSLVSNAALDTSGLALQADLEVFLGEDGAAPPAAPSTDTATEMAATGLMHVSLRFGTDSLRSGMDPISFLRYLTTLGELRSVTTLAELIPTAEQMDAESCYLGFEVSLRTEASPAEVEAVFDFVREDSDIRVLTVASAASDWADLIDSYGPHADRVRDILAAAGDGPQAAVLTAKTIEAGPGTGVKFVDRRAAEVGTIRVDATRLDLLIDTVGELLIAGAGAALGAGSLNTHEDLRNSIGEVMRLIEGVRDSALRLRMVPIGATFARFQRVVRDVGKDLGKDVALVLAGGETEVDKGLIEHIGDPLMHLVRNALDHGIESTEDRIAAGKPARGTLWLKAYHDSGSIVVVVEDDGGGINAERVLAKAVESGLVEPGATLSEKAVYGLIFEPGFSTATEISNLSGRGVGMDVVKRNVTALHGTIDIDSRPGLGTAVQIRLPLTLAIIEGFMVGVGGATFVIPLDRVVECVELPSTSKYRDFMDLRGEVLPLARLWSVFSVPGERSRRESVVVVEHAGAKTGLVVDSLGGEFQTVIKPLGRMFAQAEGVSGSTILGNGAVALIIDVAAFIAHVTARAEQRSAQNA